IAVLLVIYALTNASSGKGGTVLAPGQGSSSNAGDQPANIGQPSKSTNCVASGGLQDKACTPGAIIPDATVQQICTPGYSSSVRNVPTSEKDQVYAEYGIASHFSGQYEVDHLISLELGGSNDISNLWPELADPKPGFHEKDGIENYLHAQVCNGTMSLQKAQELIASNWLQVYNQTH
ncbi:MAG: HNH endonuclease signature motif containing protein, partial [Chloroflexota bacterium]